MIVNQTPLMLALGFEAGTPSDPITRDGLKTMLSLVIGDQDKDGAWRLMYIWEPHGSTPDVMTALALLALSAPNAPDLGAEGKTAREKGLKWLAATPPADTPQADGLRLVLLKRLGRPPAEWEPLLIKLLARQNADGGWGQAARMKSDAFATGQALYALAEAGRKPDDPAVAKARTFWSNPNERTVVGERHRGRAGRCKSARIRPHHPRRHRLGDFGLMRSACDCARAPPRGEIITVGLLGATEDSLVHGRTSPNPPCRGPSTVGRSCLGLPGAGSSDWLSPVFAGFVSKTAKAGPNPKIGLRQHESFRHV